MVNSVGNYFSKGVVMVALIAFFYQNKIRNRELVHDEVVYGKPDHWDEARNISEFEFSLDGHLSKNHPLYADISTFKGDIIQSQKKYVLVIFYDPMSPDYQLLGKKFVEAGLWLEENSDVDAAIRMVNIRQSSYLSRLYTPHQNSALWVDFVQRESVKFGEFQFGHPLTFSMASRGFYRGKPVVGYKGRIITKNILAYMKAKSSSILQIESIQEFENNIGRLNENGVASIVHLCLPTDYTRGQCNSDIDMEQALIDFALESSSTSVILSTITENVLCQKLHPGFRPCNIVVAESRNLKQLKNVTFHEATMMFQKASDEEFMSEIVINEAVDFFSRSEHVCILLINPEDVANFEKAEVILKRVKAILNTSLNFRFVWGRASHFAQLFEHNAYTFPNLVYYSRSRYGIYSTMFSKKVHNTPKFLSLVSASEEATFVMEWIDRMITGTGITKPFSQVPSDESNDSKHASVSQQMNGITSDEASKKHQMRLLQAVKDNLVNSAKPWHLQARNLNDYIKAPFEDVWSMLKWMWFEYLEMEQIFAGMSKDERYQESEFFHGLNKVRNYLSQPQFGAYSHVFRSFPANPNLLQSMLESSERKKLLTQIERYDALRTFHFRDKGEKRVKLVHETLAQAVHTLEQSMIGIQLKRGQAFLAQNEGKITAETQIVLPIDRVSAHDLSLHDFVSKYETKGVPVIIKDLKPFKTPLSIERIKDLCGQSKVSLKLQEQKNWARFWAGLRVDENSHDITMAEFLKSFGESKGKFSKHYLHDWSIPINCPKLLGALPFEEYQVPKYFLGDYYQRMPLTFALSWPSLFVGPKGTASSLHVDSAGSHFWLYLQSGQKDWRIYPKEEVVNLYMNLGTVSFHFDPFHPDYNQFPLAAKAKVYSFTQHPGELVFVPSKCAHAVLNTDNIVGFSMNYVDESNYYQHLWQNLKESVVYWNFEYLANRGFPRGWNLQNRNGNQDIPFGLFKSYCSPVTVTLPVHRPTRALQLWTNPEPGNTALSVPTRAQPFQQIITAVKESRYEVSDIFQILFEKLHFNE